MKTLKFRGALSKLVLDGKKTTTWRLFDDKNISAGDEVLLVVWENKKEFAKAKIIDVKERKFKDMTDEDWEGHEKFSSEDELYKTYSIYYNQKVDKNTIVKIIKFKII